MLHASIVIWLPTFRNNLSASSSRVKVQYSSRTALPLKTGPTGYSEASAIKCQPTLGNIPEERLDLFYTAVKFKSHIALFYCTGKTYVPQLGLGSFLNSHDVPTEKVPAPAMLLPQ